MRRAPYESAADPTSHRATDRAESLFAARNLTCRTKLIQTPLFCHQLGPSDCPPERASKKIEFYVYLRRSPANASKTTPLKALLKRTNKFSKVLLLPKKYPEKRNIVSDCKSTGRKEPSFNVLFLVQNIVNPYEIYMDGICK